MQKLSKFSDPCSLGVRRGPPEHTYVIAVVGPALVLAGPVALFKLIRSDQPFLTLVETSLACFDAADVVTSAKIRDDFSILVELFRIGSFGV